MSKHLREYQEFTQTTAKLIEATLRPFIERGDYVNIANLLLHGATMIDAAYKAHEEPAYAAVEIVRVITRRPA